MPAPVRVVHVVGSLGVGGLEHGVVNLVNELRDGFAQTIVCVGRTGAAAARLPAEVPVLALDKRPDRRMLLAPVRLARLFRDMRPHVVHSRNWAAIDAVPAAVLARVPAIVHGEHGREADDPGGRNRRRAAVRRLFAPLVQRFVAVSEDLGRWLTGQVGVPARRVVVIPNGVDTTRFHPGDAAEGRRRLGLGPDDGPVIGTVGRLDPVKDHATLIMAFARLEARAPRAVLVLVGAGPARDRLEALAAELAVGARVRFLGEREDVPALLRGLDVFVLSSVAEGMPNTVLEAMATGLPVVATRVGGAPELVEDGVTGTLVDAGASDALAQALTVYLVEAERRREHGRAGRRRAVRCFGLQRTVDAYRTLYGSLVGAPGAV